MIVPPKTRFAHNEKNICESIICASINDYFSYPRPRNALWFFRMHPCPNGAALLPSEQNEHEPDH